MVVGCGCFFEKHSKAFTIICKFFPPHRVFMATSPSLSPMYLNCCLLLSTPQSLANLSTINIGVFAGGTFLSRMHPQGWDLPPSSHHWLVEQMQARLWAPPGGESSHGPRAAEPWLVAFCVCLGPPCLEILKECWAQQPAPAPQPGHLGCPKLWRIILHHNVH